VRDGCAKLAEALERRDFAGNKFWKLIAPLPRHPSSSLRREKLSKLIELLKSRTDMADACEQELLAKTPVWEGDAWSKFIVRLGRQWRTKGLKPTAPKSEEQKRSAFVAWVALLMNTLPEPLRQHMKGTEKDHWGAINKAVSRSLLDWDRILKLIEDSPQGELKLASDEALRRYPRKSGISSRIARWQSIARPSAPTAAS
jgi:hypothetical protein